MLKTTNNIQKKIQLILFTVCFIVISCNQQNANEIFIVPTDTMPIYKTSNSNIPPPPPPNRAYYFPSNFIVDTEGEIFFYQQQIKLNDDEVRNWNTPPQFINLNPNDIVQVPVNSIEEFIKLNILNKDSLKRYVSIASEKDTINSIGLSKIIAICKDKKYSIRWKFRIATQEETIVLNYKKQKQNYYPEKVKWDTTKILMPLAFTQNQ